MWTVHSRLDRKVGFCKKIMLVCDMSFFAYTNCQKALIFCISSVKWSFFGGSLDKISKLIFALLGLRLPGVMKFSDQRDFRSCPINYVDADFWKC